MTIEELLELPTDQLEAIAKDETRLQEEFGWCLSVTRPSTEARERLVKTGASKKPKGSSPKKLQTIAKQTQLDAAKQAAMEAAAKMGITLQL